MSSVMEGFLESILKAIDEDRFDDIVQGVQQLLEQHPEYMDMRAVREVGLIQKLLEYRADLQDWDYFRNLKTVYEVCEERYARDDICGTAPDPRGTLAEPETIWWCWLQGLDAAPPVAGACLRSLQGLGRTIRIVDEENLSDLVTMPDHILDKWHRGIITPTHFSDLLRLELLTTRGGAWFDATSYCSDPDRLNGILRSAPLFCHRVVMRDGSSEYTTYDSWLVSSTAPSAILHDTKQMLYAYWADEDRLMHYFLFHIFFTLATWRHPEECARIPVFSTEPCHVMQMEMLHLWSEVRWQQLVEMSCIHKLTWKYDTKQDLAGTILGYVLSQDEPVGGINNGCDQ